MSDRRLPGYPGYPGYPPPPMGYQPPQMGFQPHVAGFPNQYPPPMGPGYVPTPYHPYYMSYPQGGPQMGIVPSAPEVTVEVSSEAIAVEPEVVELPWRAYRWVPATTYSMPPGALHVGTDQDGSEIYAARARHEGDILPAKVIPSKSACYIAHNGEEHQKQHFEVLVPATFAWQFSTGGSVPPGAVEVGATADGEKLYMGRVTAEGAQTPGKIHPSHGVCYYPFDGEERSSDEYEVLVFH